jgi:hypothetical protein
MKHENILRKLKKAYIKMLSAYARRLIARGYELEDKVIMLELKLKESEE